jgi:hypothetical protein
MFTTIGKYEILRLLGKGSMGEVYLGLDPSLGREVAIKTIQPGNAFDTDGKARFEREARAMAALNHPNIVTIFDFGTVEDRLYLAMEYLPGDDLATLIQRGALDRLQLLEALAQACEGLGFAHSRGVIHRDVKPGNILVGVSGKRILAKLMDFGVASVDRSSLTEQGVWMGTVSYMAPEYLDTGKASGSADIFAAGVIMYEILTGGRRPFAGESTTAILTAILRHPAEKMTEAERQGVPPAVLAVMDRALAKDPSQRFPTADDLATALREALAGPVPETAAPAAALQQIVVGKGGGATCLSLRVAVRQAAPGTVILVLPGLYREAVLVDKDLTFQGEGEAADIVLEAPSGACLTVDNATCAFRGLTFQRRAGGAAVDLRSGSTTLEACVLPNLRIGAGASAVLRDCGVAEAGTLPGLLVEGGGQLTLTRTTVSNPLGVGVRLLPGARLTAEDSAFLDNPLGSVELGTGSSGGFLRCHLLRSRFAGVLAFEQAQATLKDCVISGHAGAGLHAMAGAQLTLTGCRILDNGGLGLAVVDAGRATLEYCEISANGQPGLLLHRGGSARLSQCQVVDGQSLGIACHQGAELTLEHSVLRGNAAGGILLGPGSGPPRLSEGNTLEDSILR